MNKLSHIAFILLCISASVWFVRTSTELLDKKIDTNLTPETQEISQSSSFPPSASKKKIVKKHIPVSVKQKISSLLKKQQFSTAVETFNGMYDELDDSTIQTIQSLFYQTAQNYLSQKKASLADQLMAEYLGAIQDEQAYILLARSHVMQSNHRDAIDAVISAYGLAFDSTRQQRIEQYAVQIALNYYAEQQKKFKPQDNKGSFDDVLQTLMQLHYLFPENAELTYQTANLLGATGDLVTAQQYLSSLVYTNNDYSQAANTLLNAIAQQQVSPTPEQSNNNPRPTQSSASVTAPPPAPELLDSNSIVVPLQRSGSSYLVDVVINQSPVTLLLDTGASITALSETVVDRLRLDKTNRRVRLSTANGTRTSNIYRADSLQLNSVQLNKVAVVEIKLGSRSRIDGLLGTDILQQFNYQIDNRSNSLILSPRQ